MADAFHFTYFLGSLFKGILLSGLSEIYVFLQFKVEILSRSRKISLKFFDFRRK